MTATMTEIVVTMSKSMDGLYRQAPTGAGTGAAKIIGGGAGLAV